MECTLSYGHLEILQVYFIFWNSFRILRNNVSTRQRKHEVEWKNIKNIVDIIKTSLLQLL